MPTCASDPTGYRHREPESTVLHAVMRKHLTNFLAMRDVPRNEGRTLRGDLDLHGVS